MGIEQLKLILDVVSSASEGAYIIGLLWMLKGYFVHILIVGVIVLVVLKGSRLISTSMGLQRFMNECRRLAGCSSPYGYLTPEEEKFVYNTIKKGKEK